MLNKLFKKYALPKKQGMNNNTADTGADESTPVYHSLIDNEKFLRREFGSTRDLIIRHFVIAGRAQAMLVYLDNMVDLKIINEHILEPLMEERTYPVSDLEDLVRTVISVGQISTASKMKELLTHVLYGNAAVFVDNMPQALVVESKGWQHRAIEKPETESNVFGPQEAFIESAVVNQTIIRRRVRSTKLRFDQMTVGEVTQTDVVVTYIEGLAKPELVDEVKRRLKNIKIDGTFCCGYFMELMDDNPTSPFPTIDSTERPDRLVSSLLEGRVGIIIDGAPFTLIVPVRLINFLMVPDDYYQRFYFSTVMRWLRILAFAIALTLPSLYIAVTTHHQEMLPTPLALTIAGAREGIPFPAFVEALLMEIAFELVREGGLRLPKAIGQTVSIVGALILGQAAVEAGIVSATMVIVVAFTGIASFAIPGYHAAVSVRLLRFPLMVLAALWGLPGLMCGLLILACHMVALTSFGQPYLSPVAPYNFSAWKDTIFRVPWWIMTNRPSTARDKNRKRMQPFIPPKRGDNGES